MTDVDFGLALEEGRRAFDQQAADMSKVRDRAASVMGFGSLATSFLGGLALRDKAPLSLWTWGVVATFVALTVICILLLRPRKIFAAMDPKTIVSWSEDQGASRSDMERDLALRYGEVYVQNQLVHRRLMRWYGWAVVALAVLVLLLIADVWSR
jgi:hypothetical protein